MRYLAAVLLMLSTCAAPALAALDPPGRLYGRVTTRSGKVFEGLLRWDKNEVSWLDVLNGSKPPAAGPREEGLRLLRAGQPARRATESGIRFGHLRTIEPRGRDRALLTLRSGQQVAFFGGSTDLGTDSRGFLVEDARQGLVELSWQEIVRVDLLPAPTGAASRFGERLTGTLTTRRGMAFTGLVCWDVDEALADDVLDGTDPRGRDLDLRFGDIAVLERAGDDQTRVTLRNGDAVVLGGTNDVDAGNRGLLILDPALGQVRVGWADFARLVLGPAGPPVRYEAFGGAGPLRGTVETRDGDRLTGDIRWDNDEAYAWEFLNGRQDDADFDIEFGLVHAVERLSANAARVTLRDGRTLDLRGSNDVTEANLGIFVTPRGGDEIRVDWRSFERVVFDKP